MLKRTMMLLGLTITVGALLLVVGCGGSNSTMPVGANNSSVSRQENEPPTAPLLVRPNGMKIVYVKDGKIRFVMQATDPDGDRLWYRVVLKDQNGNVIATFDQTLSSSGWSKSSYASGEYAILAVPLPAGTYSWNAQAFDGKEWGPFHNPDANFIYDPK